MAKSADAADLKSADLNGSWGFKSPSGHQMGNTIRLPLLTRSPFFHVRQKSLPRGTVLVIGSLALAVAWSGFPVLRPTPKLILPTALSLYGTWETARCLRMRWSFYHGGVLLLLYADIIAVAMIVFLLLYPYAGWLL